MDTTHFKPASLILSAVAALLILASCSSDEPAAPASEDSEIAVSAAVSKSAASEAGSRGSADPVPIEEGTYYFSYPLRYSNGNLIYATMPCFFVDAVGRVYPSPTPLQWKDMPSLKDYTFTLDNVGVENNIKLDDLTFFGVRFDESNLPFYSAAIEPDEGRGSNDIIWGRVEEIAPNTPTLQFVLTHRMSRLSVSIMDPDFIKSPQQDVTIRITNIVTEPESFNRVDGTVAIAESPVYNSFTLVDEAPLTHVAANGTTEEYYTSPNLILPPQNLPEGTGRPRLEVTIGEKTYTGVLPTGMINSEDGVPSSLDLLADVHVELRIKKLAHSLDKEEIEFLPAVLRKWVDKGEHVINSTQAGIYNSADLQAAIEAFNSGNKELLKRYGYFVYDELDDLWSDKASGYVFNLFSNVDMPGTKLNRSAITALTNGAGKIYIDFHGYRIGDYRTWESIKDVIIDESL